MSMRIAVVGYASVDHAMETDEFRAASGTTLIQHRLSEPWPDVGGIAYAARGLAAAGHQVHAVTWIGKDQAGDEYTERLSSYGVDVTGVAARGNRTPSCYLFYGPDGETVVVYDPGDHVPTELTATQRELVAECDWVCMLVAPRPVNLEVLDRLTDNQSLAWGVKGDPDAYSAGVVLKMLSRASVICFSARERIFLDRMIAPRSLRDRARKDAFIAETHGTAGVKVWQGDHRDTVPCTPIDAVDTTGAGDMFFAGAVASMIERPGDTRRAAERGVAAATSLLRGRQAAHRCGEPVR